MKDWHASLDDNALMALGGGDSWTNKPWSRFMQIMPKKLELRLLDPGQQDETEEWYVGSRYCVLSPLSLTTQPELSSTVCGILQPGSVALVMALQEMEIEKEASVEVCLMAYLAETSTPGWVFGWCCLEGCGFGPEGKQTLSFGRLRYSWVVGGRYRVKGQLALREDVALESALLRDISRYEEVIVLVMGLVLRAEKPRLRALVLTEAGEVGWVTVEVTSGPPLLDSTNLLSKVATRPGLFRSSPCRRNLPGQAVWKIGGEYRLLERVSLLTSAEIGSTVVSTLQRGDVVTVEAIEDVDANVINGPILRLKVRFRDYGPDGTEPSVGWISGHGDFGEFILDVRNQRDYEEWQASQKNQDPGVCPQASDSSRARSSQGDTSRARSSQEFEVRLHRPKTIGQALGATVNVSDGKTLLVQNIEDNSSLSDWNARCRPWEVVLPGYRIVSVNGKMGVSSELLEEICSEFVSLVVRRANPAVTTENAIEHRPDVVGPAHCENSGCDLQQKEVAKVQVDPLGGPTGFEDEERLLDIAPGIPWRRIEDVFPTRYPSESEHLGGKDSEWRPVGVSVDDVPDFKTVGDAGNSEERTDPVCGPCRPCREEGLLAAIFACASSANRQRLASERVNMYETPYTPFLPTETVAAVSVDRLQVTKSASMPAAIEPHSYNGGI